VSYRATHAANRGKELFELACGDGGGVPGHGRPPLMTWAESEGLMQVTQLSNPHGVIVNTSFARTLAREATPRGRGPSR
jgi:hypothetical protein